MLLLFEIVEDDGEAEPTKQNLEALFFGALSHARTLT